MCNRYHPPRSEVYWEEFRAMPPENLPVGPIFPRRPGPFIRAGRIDGARQTVVGQWGLIPFFAKALPLKYSTNNSRIETAPTAATFKAPWARGQRCIIPAASFDEPNWESGKNEWWRFRRADGRAWGLAGLWSDWTDPATGQVSLSYSMLTMNADTHPLMSRMHKPDPKLASHEQDKRSVIAIKPDDWDTWLRGPIDSAHALIRLTAIEDFDAGPDDAP
ncbi:MAG: SOS response-associated peptidase family protein [Pseudolysinimonas sp.]